MTRRSSRETARPIGVHEQPAVDRLRGRQAEAAVNDTRVLNAAREIFATAGWEAPVSLVAQRAGVGMGSLYRRYGSKENLLRHLCLLSLQQMVTEAETALNDSAGSDWQKFESFVRSCVSHRAGAFGPIAGHLPPSIEMTRAAERVNHRVQQLVRRTQRAGALRSDVTPVDVYQLLELFSRSERVVGPAPSQGAASDLQTIRHERILTVLLAGFRPEAAAVQPLPRATSWRSYRARWVTPASERPDPS
ncbi:TetR/AcrR family transcriptional regulator [Jatrophihabitans lederbergiae]|uniref:Helix-turn-helix domain-containing protein n=1 Tax=Jatrophihabitans lederbergiae TaxID=3075547 RepID=A0ABU2J7U6_9ACTN|nr:helix-turn-helix domain-containing protein [Jatrophihabitans sp. DSM 44399]MDT0260788.1 helix-turn-helix domain-containing protein [Jatrophihabitans sp. DSM 44399]